MDDELYQPSEGWLNGSAGTKKDRENGCDFLGVASDWEEPSYW